MTTTPTTFHSEPHEDRIKELLLLIEMVVCSTEQDLFTGQQRAEKTAALGRIAEKI